MAPPLSESLTPHATDTPNQLFVKDVSDSMSEPSRKQLPLRQTRGILKPTYESNFLVKKKYPMTHHVSNHHLSESNKSFINQSSVVSIPSGVHEALADPRWKSAMNEEMKPLQNNET